MLTKREREEFGKALKEGVRVLTKALKELSIQRKESQEFHKKVEKKTQRGVRRTHGVNL